MDVYSLHLLPLILLASALCTQPLLASNQAPNKTQELAMEEVIVSAERREANLQSLPLSVSAFSKATLLNMNVMDIGDLQNAVPNLTLHEGDAANAVVYLRGVGQVDSLAFADPGVGIYLDEVYLGRAQGAFLDLLDVEQIEVLRGPQGTLYGRNTIGGAINYTSAAPSEVFASELSTSIGNYQQQNFKASVSGPLIENKLLGKLSIAQLGRDGYATNSVDNSDDGDKDTFAWRSSLSYNPSGSWQFGLTLDSSRNDADSSRTPARLTPVFTSSSNAIPANTDPFLVSANFNDLNKLDIAGIALKASVDINQYWSFKSISSKRKMDYQSHLDLDASSSAMFGIFVDQDQQQWSQELQLSYDNGDATRLVSGLYYFHEQDVTQSGAYGPDTYFLTYATLWPAMTNSINDQTNDSYAIYTQLDQALSDKWSMSAGLRYTREKKDLTRRQEDFSASDPLPLTMGTGVGTAKAIIHASDSWSELSPKLGMQYQIQRDLMLYGSISQGFKSGGFDGRSKSADDATAYRPETLTAYEAGIKSEWLNRRLRVNAALFFNDYKDMQLSGFGSTPSGFEAQFTNAGKANIGGLEVELSALLSKDLSVDLNLGYMDAEYDEYIGPSGTDISAQRRLVNTPEWTARLAPQYRLPLSNLGEVTLSTDISYRSKTYSTVSSSEVLAQDSYSLINASATYVSEDEHWRLQLSAKNLTDKHYITQGFDLSDYPGYQLGYYGAPRTYSLSASYRY